MSPNGNKYMNDEENPELKLAFGFLQNTGENVFLTGKAGTGKTTFLHNLKKTAHKRMVVFAPTGVAAINAKGATIHSFFQMPFGPQVPGANTDSSSSDQISKRSAGNQIRRFSREKLNIIRSLDLVVIDEISMVRADLLDGIDEVIAGARCRGARAQRGVRGARLHRFAGDRRDPRRRCGCGRANDCTRISRSGPAASPRRRCCASRAWRENRALGPR